MTDWTAQVNNYCERVDLSFWSEPVNAVTNAAFLIAALVVARALRRPDPVAWALIGLLSAIGVGSFLFHTFATRWALLADVLPILLFILTYVGAATTRFFGLPWWAGVLAGALYIPYSVALSIGLAALLGPLNGSISYLPVPVLIAAYGFVLRPRAPRTARGLMFGVGLLTLSLVFRTVDQAVCPSVGLGTHFLWHILNGIMLGWMIWVIHRHGDGARPKPQA